GVGSRPSNARAMAGTFGPDSRTTPMPAAPAAVAIATMVSRCFIGLGGKGSDADQCELTRMGADKASCGRARARWAPPRRGSAPIAMAGTKKRAAGLPSLPKRVFRVDPRQETLLRNRRLRAVALGDDPLLRQAEDAVGAPVQHQARGEEGHQHAEGDRHEGHDLLLDRKSTRLN